MSWIAMGGSRGGAGRPDGDSDEDDGGGGGGGGGRSFRGVPLCGAAMCSGKGMPPRRLQQPGLDCVNRDDPCMPCDIINLKLRAAVTGIRVKRAVAECQKRYFCRVWNLLFAWLLPDFRPGPCIGLKSGDIEVKCRARGAADKRPKQPTGQDRRLPYGAEPGRMASPAAPQPARAKRIAFDDAPEPDASTKPLPPATTTKRRRDRGGLRYNIWDMPMPDSTKGSKTDD